jgi:nucleoside phosphorylase/HEAT repeat protein
MNTDFVIITALEEEREALLAKLPDVKKLPPSEEDVRVYYRSSLPVTFPDKTTSSYDIIVLSLLGMGRVQAVNAAVDSIKRWKPRYLLLVGIAGGVEENDVSLGDILVSDQFIDYELQKLKANKNSPRYQVHPADSRLLIAAQNLVGLDWLDSVTVSRPKEGVPKRHIGPIATGDKVVERKAFVNELLNHWPKLVGFEMEAGGAASACFQSPIKPGFFMVRGVSDLSDENKSSTQVKAWRCYACAIAAAYTVALLQSGPVPPRKNVGSSPDEDLIKTYLEEISTFDADLDDGPFIERFVSPTKTPFHLGPNDITDTIGFAKRILGEEDKLSRYIKNRLSSTTLEMLGNLEVTNSNQERLKRALADGLNKILDGESLWDTGYFEEDKLTGQTKELLGQTHQGAALIRFNRLLLTEAFPGMLRDVLPEASSLYETLRYERKIVLLAEPGAGKTTATRHLASKVATRSLEIWREGESGEIYIPIYVELKHYRGEQEIETLLAQSVNDFLYRHGKALATTLDKSTQAIKNWMLGSGMSLCLLFDGLNEVPSQYYSNIRRLLMTVLNSPGYVAVSCREKDYDESLQTRAPAFGLCNLKPEEINKYLEAALGQKEGQDFYYRHFGYDEKLLALASNPLMLWLFKEVASNTPNISLPRNRGRLIREFAMRMPRVRRREGVDLKVPLDIVLKALAWLAFKMQSDGVLFADLGMIREWAPPTGHWPLDDILIQSKDWRFLKADGRTGEPIEFLHQLFLEYFAASYIASLPYKPDNYDNLLSEHVLDKRWHEVILMLGGIIDDPQGLIAWLVELAINKEDARLVELVVDCKETTELTLSAPVERRFIRALVAGSGDLRSGSARENHFSRVLTSMGQSVVEPLIEIVQELNERQRRLAPESIGQKEPPNSRTEVGGEIYAGYLQRTRVIRILAKIQDERAISLMVALLADDEADGYRWDIIRVTGDELRKFGALGVEPLLQVICDDSQPYSRRAHCLVALNKIGLRTHRVSQVLDSCLREGLSGNIELLNKSLWVASQLKDRQQTGHALNALLSEDQEVVASAAAFFKKVPSDAAYEPLKRSLRRFESLKSHPFSSTWGVEQILRALNALGTDAAVRTVRKYLLKGIEAGKPLRCHNAIRLAEELGVKGVRSLALKKTLLELDSKEENRDLGDLLEFISNTWQPELLSELKRSARQPTQECLTELVSRIAKNHKRQGRKHEWGEGSDYQEILNTLAKCQVPNFVEQVCEMLPETDWLVEEDLCDALWVTADTQAEVALLHQLEAVSPYEPVRPQDKYHIVRALATCGKEKGVSAAVNYIRENPNLSIYLPEEVFYLMVRRRVLPIREIERMALDSDGTHIFVREFCVQTLGMINAPKYSDLFCKIISGSEDQRIQSYAINLLGWTKKRSAITKLEEVLKNTKSLSLAIDAMNALFRLDADDVVQLVNKAIERFVGEKHSPALLRAGAKWKSPSTLALIKTIIGDQHRSGYTFNEFPAAIGEFYEDSWARARINEYLDSPKESGIDFGEQSQAIKAIAKHDTNLALTQFIKLSDSLRITENSQLAVIWRLPSWAKDTKVDPNLLIKTLVRLLCDVDLKIREKTGETLYLLDKSICEGVFEELNKQKEDWAQAAAVSSLGYWSNDEQRIKAHLYHPARVVRYFAENALHVREKRNALQSLVRVFLSSSGVGRFAAFECLGKEGAESVMSLLYSATSERSMLNSYLRKLGSRIEQEIKRAREKRAKEEDELFSLRMREVKFS